MTVKYGYTGLSLRHYTRRSGTRRRFYALFRTQYSHCSIYFYCCQRFLVRGVGMGATPAAPSAPAVGVLRARPPRSLHGKSTAPETPRRLAGANAPATLRMPSAELCGAASGSGVLLDACCWCRTTGQWVGRDSRLDGTVGWTGIVD